MDVKKKYWKSLEEFHNDPKLADAFEKEFLSSPFSETDGATDGLARRDFLKLMGASLALTSFGCIRRPVQKIVPYANAPEEMVPGIPNYYSSSWVSGGEGFGLVVKTREGRPLKVEGNPSHPINQGALSARAQGHLLNMYDPDRVNGAMKVGRSGKAEGTQVAWGDLDKVVTSKLKEGGVYILSSSLGSPTTSNLISDFAQGFGAKHVVWDPLSPDDVVEGQKASYGTAVLPRLRFDLAKMIVSVDCDFLGTFVSPTGYTKEFSKMRKPGQGMNKLVAFESVTTLTGANSDVKFTMKPSQQLDVVMGLLHELVVKQGKTRYASDGQVKAALAGYAGSAQKLNIKPEVFAAIATDLWNHKGESLVAAGGLAGRTANGLALQIATNLLNSALENDGKTIDATVAPFKSFEGSYSAMNALIEDMKSGKVKTLIVHRSNPAYSLPADSGFKEALAKVGFALSTSDRVDETASLCDYLAPDLHDMENWGDTEIQAGVYSIIQPTIRPLFNGRAFQSSLMIWAQSEKRGSQRMLSKETWYSYLRDSWKALQGKSGRGGSFEDFWVEVLHEGVLDLSAKNRKNTSGARNFKTAALASVPKQSSGSGLELVLYPKISIGDGSLANVSWLQELPDPVTKCLWASYFTVSPGRAQKLGIKKDQVIEMKVAGETVRLSAFIQPGQHDDVVGLAVGQGRTHAGRVGNGVGVNGFSFAQFNKGQPIFAGRAVELAATPEVDEIPCTQGHDLMEGRQIIVQTTLEEYLKKPSSGIEKHEIMTTWPKHEYKGHKWAMAIDQNSCTGCSACVVACMSENNIPAVGKAFILRGREMHWLRIDRYYAGDVNGNPDFLFQPMLCQHCDNAPCETVCPVQATVHGPEGLNEMVYNRCVGTRYCSNNCPYKVRRFNWFNYAKDDNPYANVARPANLSLNPEVTTRTRGVMEKCTFCVQRIHAGKNEARDKKVALKDGDIKTACEQTCPADAIVFGDMNNPESRVSKLFKDPRIYGVLEEFNTAPSVRYMSKIRNAKRTSSPEGVA